ncbi:MAG: pilus assembly protein PilM [Planctomycetes bacterium]|nr:pilus assembly protein PilM [Planctomycetota bacterium]
MVVGWTKGKILPIGIDLGTAKVKMAQLRAHPSGKLSLIAAGSEDVPPSARKEPSARARFLTDAIRRLYAAAPFKGRQCVLSLPSEMTFVQHIKMAKMPDSQLTSSLYWELQGKLPYDPSQAVIRHVVAGEIYTEKEVKQEVIVLVVNRRAIESHVNFVRRAKLECIGVNVETCAIMECFARLFRRADDADRATLFIDIGATSTQAVIGKGPQMAFAKNIFIAAAQFDQAVADGLQVSLDEARRIRSVLAAGGEIDRPDRVFDALNEPMNALAVELTSCLRYYESVFPNCPLDRAIFLGGQAYDKRLCQTLAQKLSIPAQIGDPLTRIEREALTLNSDYATGDVSGPEWAVAIGLSLGWAVSTNGATRTEEVLRI